MAGEKLQIALYWGAACGGCDVAVLDTNEFILDVHAAADIRLWPIAVDGKYADVEAMEDGELDLALYNGAVRNSENEHIAKLLRRKSKVLVAFGSCAHLGGIPGLANLASRDEIMNVAYLHNPSIEKGNTTLPRPESGVNGSTLTIPEFYKRVYKLDDVVPVDYYVPGCPPAADRIKEVLQAVVSGGLPVPGSVVGANETALCDECPRTKNEKKVKAFHRPWQVMIDPETCLLEQGVLCAGVATRGGCGARCPSSGIPCRGCYGPLPGVVDQGAKLLSAVVSVIDSNDAEEIDRILDGPPDFTAVADRSSGADAEGAEEMGKKEDLAAAGEEIAAVCDKFFSELDYTMDYMNLRRSGEPLAKIIVTGGGALFEPFNSALARYFSTPIEKLDLRTIRHISLPAEAVNRWNPLRMNNALALALRGLQKGSGGFNFRRDEITGGGYFLPIKENFKGIAAVVLIILGILALTSVAGYFIDQLRLANMKTEIAGILKKSSPEITRIVDPVQQLKTKVLEAKKFAGAGGGAGALELLRKISESVPPSDNLLISDLNFDGEKVAIRAETTDFDSVEKIKRDIAGSGFFRNVSVSGANMIKDKNRVEFEMRMNCAR